MLDENKNLLSEYTISHDGPETIIHTIPKPIEAPKINGVPNVRFVKVLSGPGSDSYLQISQLVVRDEKGDNVAKGKPAFSSTNSPGTRPDIAVDGHEGARSPPLLYISNTPNNAWWMVDLQKTPLCGFKLGSRRAAQPPPVVTGQLELPQC